MFRLLCKRNRFPHSVTQCSMMGLREISPGLRMKVRLQQQHFKLSAESSEGFASLFMSFESLFCVQLRSSHSSDKTFFSFLDYFSLFMLFLPFHFTFFSIQASSLPLPPGTSPVPPALLRSAYLQTWPLQRTGNTYITGLR